ncbi:MAG: hypothetical protein ACJ73D_10860 [Pyrinomonadaceae bacterium]
MLVKRAIALCLGLLLAIGALIPLATNDVDAAAHHRRHRHHRHYKKYSKQWWREYHRRHARMKAVAARKRALRLQQLRLAKAAADAKANGQDPHAAVTTPQVKKATNAALPSGDPAPAGWTAAKSSPAEMQFRIDNSSGSQVGSAAISVVGPSTGDPSAAGRSKTVGGVATAALRRDVIDRMIRENGWVVNDYQKDIGGQHVYVVEAQSQARNGQTQQRMFYFTEVEGKIYSVATSSPVNESERLAEESEKVINSLKARIKPGLRASN